MARSFKLPDLGEGVHEGEVLKVHVETGRKITEGDLILTVETDKAAVEIPSPYTGTVAQIMVKAGDTVHVGDVMMTFEDETQEKPEQMQVPKAQARRQGPVPASPATRRLARELDVDLHQVPPSGPHGLVTAEDVRAHAETARRQEKTAPVAQEPEAAAQPSPLETGSVPGAPELPDFSRWGPVKRLPVRSIRRATARQMALSWSQVPHVSSQDSANITRLEQFRQKHRQAIEQNGGRLTFTVFALKAAVTALKRFPDFNASLDPAAGEIVRKHYYHIGVAVNTDQGLVVPVIRDVDRKSIRELAIELKDLAARTHARKISREELQGGTFTITNAGAMGGGGFFTPIIKFPEVGIMGMGQARMQPVAVRDGNAYDIVPQLVMPLVLCIDHRVLDGAGAIGFLKVVVDVLEDPEEMLISMV
jgi:pyruvate dehydrogenase E2 component (dihydrolipoamide acetyltransferase)